MRCLIVDDDVIAQKNLSHWCSKIEELEVVGICGDGLEAMKMLKAVKVDLIFLDIDMPNMSGMEMVENLKDLPQIIFITSRKDLALKAFDYDVTDYLTKPVTLPRLIMAVERATKRNESNDKSTPLDTSEAFFLKSEGRLVKILLDEVKYIETLDDYLIFKMVDSSRHLVHSSLKKMEEKLTDERFVKVHRSYIVNLKFVNSIEDTNLIIDDEVIPVSRGQKPVLLKRIRLL